MVKFVYKMQNILEIKYKLETQAKTEYAEANNRLNEEKLRLQHIDDDIHKYEDKIRELNSGKLDIMRLKECFEAVEIKKIEKETQKKEVEKARRNVELARIKLNEVMVERKTHEKLREKAFENFKTEIAEEEKKEVDELVSFSFNKSE